MEKTKKRTLAMKYATAACAALLGVFVVTNGVCYAATGETWVEKATVYVNGEPVEVDVQMTQNGDVTVGEIEYEVDTTEGGDQDKAMSFVAVDPAAGEMSDYSVDQPIVVTGEDGSVLLAPVGVEPIDITGQIAARGTATGTYELAGVTYAYTVTGSADDYQVSVEEQ